MGTIVTADVTATRVGKFQLPNVEGELAERGAVKWQMIPGKITIASNWTYATSTQIPLDNLFDSTKSSYLGLIPATCRTMFAGNLAGGATFNNHVVFDWPNKKLKVLALPLTPAENEADDEVADTTVLGATTSMTVEFVVMGQVA